MATSIPIVVASCAAYADAWGPSLALLKRFWPGPTRKDPVLVTDKFMDSGWDRDVFELGQDHGWSPNLTRFLSDKFERDECFLLLQEDFFLSGPVREEVILQAWEIIQSSKDVGCFRIYPCPGSDVTVDSWYGEVSKCAPYRISCQAAIWRTSYIYEILSRTESSWSFEIQGTKLSGSVPGRVLSVRRDVPIQLWPIHYICSAISRGKWNPSAIKLCHDLEIPIDTSKRGIDD